MDSDLPLSTHERNGCQIPVIGFVTGPATDPDPEARFERLLTLPPSAKLVYLVLDHEGPLTQQQLCDRTMLSARTARSAVTELEDVGLVTEEVYLRDARKKLYQAQPVTKPAARE